MLLDLLHYYHWHPHNWWAIKCHRPLVKCLEFSPLLLTLTCLPPLGTITVSVVLDNFLLFVIRFYWWRCLSQSVTFLQSLTSSVLDFYLLPWLFLRHQSGWLQVYLYDLDCVVLWGLPGTRDQVFSTLFFYILTHIFLPLSSSDVTSWSVGNTTSCLNEIIFGVNGLICSIIFNVRQRSVVKVNTSSSSVHLRLCKVLALWAQLTAQSDHPNMVLCIDWISMLYSHDSKNCENSCLFQFLVSHLAPAWNVFALSE